MLPSYRVWPKVLMSCVFSTYAFAWVLNFEMLKVLGEVYASSARPWMVLPRSFSARVSARPVTFCFEISKMPRGAAWISPPVGSVVLARRRSEERRVGKSVDLGGRRIIKKKKARSPARMTRAGAGHV